MPVLVIAVIFFALFIVMGVLATVAVVNETRGMPGSVFPVRRSRTLHK
jgi:multidrug efflux pump subunit AcrA (membrane-fusion protein)